MKDKTSGKVKNIRTDISSLITSVAVGKKKYEIREIGNNYKKFDTNVNGTRHL